MTQNEVINKLQQIFDEVFLDEIKVTPQLSASDVDEWDSLTHITLVVAVENKFGIRFAMGEVEATKNIGEFADLIIRLLERSSAR